MANFKTILIKALSNISLFIVCCLLFIANVNAQKVHTVKSGETLSSIAHQYRTTVGDIMRLNKLNNKSILQIGERLKIPKGKVKSEDEAEEEKPKSKPKRSEKKAAQTATPDEEETVVKIHEVKQGESLYKLSRAYNVPVDKIRAWNNLKDFSIQIGQKLYMSRPDMMPALPANPTTAPTAPVVKTNTAPVVVEEKKEPVQQPIATKPVAQTETAKVDTVVVPVSKPTPPPPPVVLEKKEPVKPVVKNNTSDEGAFKPLFKPSQQEVAGLAAILKTNAGWVDKKYYILANNIAPGTIVKVMANNISIYAKVLSSLPDIKEDAGLQFRLSNAAASVLQVNEEKFNVTVQY